MTVIGKPIIQILARTGRWTGNGTTLVAADDLFHNDPYALVIQAQREAQEWKERYEAERADHERTIEHADKDKEWSG